MLQTSFQVLLSSVFEIPPQSSEYAQKMLGICFGPRSPQNSEHAQKILRITLAKKCSEIILSAVLQHSRKRKILSMLRKCSEFVLAQDPPKIYEHAQKMLRISWPKIPPQNVQKSFFQRFYSIFEKEKF